MVIKILKETVEPKIQESVPGMLKSIYFTEISLGNRVKLRILYFKTEMNILHVLCNFFCRKCGIGNYSDCFVLKAPRIGGIKVYTENVKRSEVIMDIDVM